MQQGYLVNLVSKSRNVASTELTQGATQNFGKDIAGGELDITALKKLFTDPEKMRTFKTAFTKGQRVEIKNLMQAVEFAQRRPLGAGTFMVTVGQAGLVMAGLVGGVGYAAGGAVGAIASLTITPAMIGHILTNPKMTSLLSKGLHMKPGNPKYAATLAKLANFFGLTPTVEESF